MRVGFGYDVHRFAPERRLILGGVRIPYHLGLSGHSDADVLAHAVMDALLGAAGQGDIGRHFPDSDERYRGADSLLLLSEVGRIISSSGYCLANIDSVIVAQAPKLISYIPDMAKNMAQALGVSAKLINVKATTEEGLGFTGTGEGIAAKAVCLLEGERLCP